MSVTFSLVPIDIFLDKLHNKGIENELDAWLTFLGCDEPEYITALIEKYPYFRSLYDDLYNMCQNTERILGMFSKELQILDRNTVKYMIDELQDELDLTKEQLDSTQEQLDSTQEQLNSANATITEKDNEINKKNSIIAALQAEIDNLKRQK